MPEQRKPYIRLNLRVTKAQHARLKAAAKANNNTMQREVFQRIGLISQPQPWGEMADRWQQQIEARQQPVIGK